MTKSTRGKHLFCQTMKVCPECKIKSNSLSLRIVRNRHRHRHRGRGRGTEQSERRGRRRGWQQNLRADFPGFPLEPHIDRRQCVDSSCNDLWHFTILFAAVGRRAPFYFILYIYIEREKCVCVCFSLCPCIICKPTKRPLRTILRMHSRNNAAETSSTCTSGRFTFFYCAVARFVASCRLASGI